MYKKKIFLGIKRSSLPSPNSPNSPNSLNSLNTRQIRRRESQKFGGSLVFANSSTRQKRRIFGEYSNSLNSPASGHCLVNHYFFGNIATKMEEKKTSNKNCAKKSKSKKQKMFKNKLSKNVSFLLLK
jgi:hypothetical protein